MFLTAEELHQLTGYQRSHMQRRWLEKRGWPFEENAAGAPMVLRSMVEKRMGGAADARPERQRPKLEAIL